MKPTSHPTGARTIGPGAKDLPGTVHAAQNAGALAIDHHQRESVAELMNAVKHSGGWGVPARRLAVALSAKTRADHRAVGFPLQSLTRNAVLVVFLSLTFSTQRLCAQEIDLRTYDYSKIDSALGALKAPPNIPSSELAALLTQGLSSDHERFRAIFIWIANNIEYRWGSYGSDPERILKRKKAVCEGYASLLTTLCNSVGIECKTIYGYAKSFPDMHADLDMKKTNHAWNVVKLYGKWYVTDATWASGGYDMKKRKFIRGFDASYFLPLPERFIWSHLPEEPEWTLCDVKLSKRQFKKLPIFYAPCLPLGIVPINGATADLRRRLDIEISSDQPIEKAALRFGNSSDFIAVNVEKVEGGYRLTCNVPKTVRGVVDLFCDNVRLIGMLRS